MEIQLSDHFDYRKLLRFTLPSIAMVTFISTYTIIDGWFVSNFVGKVPFAALNLSIPASFSWGPWVIWAVLGARLLWLKP